MSISRRCEDGPGGRPARFGPHGPTNDRRTTHDHLREMQDRWAERMGIMTSHSNGRLIGREGT